MENYSENDRYFS
uniref:Uncharacterized protein n=1 Tax=Lepeophtheirus salmonis TaxID=72036 RepID=A0A0K2TAW5_LEPSM